MLTGSVSIDEMKKTAYDIIYHKLCVDLEGIYEMEDREYKILCQTLKEKYKENSVTNKLIGMIDDYCSFPEYGPDIINDILKYIRENNLCINDIFK